MHSAECRLFILEITTSGSHLLNGRRQPAARNVTTKVEKNKPCRVGSQLRAHLGASRLCSLLKSSAKLLTQKSTNSYSKATFSGRTSVSYDVCILEKQCGAGAPFLKFACSDTCSQINTSCNVYGDCQLNHAHLQLSRLHGCVLRCHIYSKDQDRCT